MIHETDAMVSNFTDMLAIAASSFSPVPAGSWQRVEVAGGEFDSPISIINTHFASMIYGQ